MGSAGPETGAAKQGHPGRWVRVSRLAAGLLLLAAAEGCYERKQDTVLNPDGSGKMLIETDVAVPATGATGKEKPTAVSYGRQFAADLINSTRGVDAWSDVTIAEAADGRAHITAVAYFKDINDLHLNMPLEFVWKWEGQNAMLMIRRTRRDVATGTPVSDAEAKDLVAKAQAQYKQQALALQTQLNAFKLQLIFQLPGEVTESHLLERDGQAVRLILDGKKIADALDKFMANDEALLATFKAGKDLSENDDFMLQAMLGEKGPVAAKVKLPGDMKPVFDYKTEMKVAQLGQADMLKQVGVELLPKFIVNPAATRGK